MVAKPVDDDTVSDDDNGEKEVVVVTRRIVGNDRTPRGPPRYLRKRFSRDDRMHIWSKTDGMCYLCRKFVPVQAFHVEHARVGLLARSESKRRLIQLATGP